MDLYIKFSREFRETAEIVSQDTLLLGTSLVSSSNKIININLMLVSLRVFVWVSHGFRGERGTGQKYTQVWALLDRGL